MSSLSDKLIKLRGRSFDELRVRGAQLLAAKGEKFSLSKQTRVPDDREFIGKFDEEFSSILRARKTDRDAMAENLLAHFRERATPRFFAAFDEPTKTTNEWRRRFSKMDAKQIIARAERMIEGCYDLLGFRDLSFGNPPDWHLEPVSQKRAPLKHWSEIDFLDPRIAGDKKITWELNRCQHFLILGRAYWLTGDEKYAETFVAQIESWMRANPPKRGINWTSSLEVAFRSIAWIWSLYFFKNSPHLSPKVFTRVLKFLYLHARHLETYPSIYFSPNTHLTGEALGLFYIGAIFPEFKRARAWRETGLKILTDALEWQARADGVYFEQTSYYQRYTADFYTHLVILAERNKFALSPIIKTKLQQLLEHLLYITRPDGTTPFYGDDDGGRLVMLDGRAANDFRSTLSNGAAIFWRGDFKFIADELAEETLWLLGADGAKKFDDIKAHEPRQTSRAFRESGYFVMREAWRRDADFLLIDCGAHGSQSCGHAHADALSFDLSLEGQQIFVDAGTVTYTGSPATRNHFRSTAAHNALTIDDESQSAPSVKPFRWETVADANLKTWRAHGRFDYFAGAQNGYARLQSPALHTRSVLFLKNDYIIMRDAVKTRGAHAYQLNFHCAPEIKTHLPVGRFNDALLLLKAEDQAHDFTPRFRLSVFDSHGRGAWNVRPDYVSRCYGAVEDAETLAFNAEARGDAEFVSFIFDATITAHETLARKGRAFEIEVGATRDLLLIGDGARIETARVSTDAEWCWIRLTRDEPTEILLLNASEMIFRGALDFHAARRVGFLTAQRRAAKSNEWHIETDAADYKFRLARKTKKQSGVESPNQVSSLKSQGSNWNQESKECGLPALHYGLEEKSKLKDQRPKTKIQIENQQPQIGNSSDSRLQIPDPRL
jgi:hypothetical protein